MSRAKRQTEWSALGGNMESIHGAVKPCPMHSYFRAVATSRTIEESLQQTIAGFAVLSSLVIVQVIEQSGGC